MTRTFCRLFAGAGALALALIASSCAGPSEQRRPEQPLLEDRAMLFDGAVEVAATLAPPFQRLPGPGGADREGRPHRGGGGRRRGGGGFDGPRPGGDDLDAGGRRGMGLQPGFMLPTHRLTVRFANRGTEPVSFRVNDVQSLLGTVAVHPDRLTLEPGQSAELDPILASPGAFFEQLDVAIVVRRGDGAETIRLNLRRPAQ